MNRTMIPINSHSQLLYMYMQYMIYICVILYIIADLTLRCLARLPPRNEDTEQPPTKQFHKSSPSPSACVGAIVIALCCHQRCDWKNFVGREILEDMGFTSLDFYLLCHMTSWGVCGVRPPKECNDDEPTDHLKHSEATVEGSRTKGYTPHPKEHIGLMCKRFIDFVRVSYLESRGYSAKLVYYTDREVSLENVLLIAVPSDKCC